MTKDDRQGQLAIAVALTLVALPVYMMIIGSVISEAVERHQRHPWFYRGIPPYFLEAHDWVFIAMTGLIFAVTTISVFWNAAKNQSANLQENEG